MKNIIIIYHFVFQGVSSVVCGFILALSAMVILIQVKHLKTTSIVLRILQNWAGWLGEETLKINPLGPSSGEKWLNLPIWRWKRSKLHRFHQNENCDRWSLTIHTGSVFRSGSKSEVGQVEFRLYCYSAADNRWVTGRKSYWKNIRKTLKFFFWYPAMVIFLPYLPIQSWT